MQEARIKMLNPKLQISNPKQIPNSKLQIISRDLFYSQVWNLNIVWSATLLGGLVLGFWDFQEIKNVK